MSQAVKVVVRCRPMNQKEKDQSYTKSPESQNVIFSDEKLNQIQLHKIGDKDALKIFTYDNVFGIQSLQQTLYQQTAFPLVESVIEGYNGTIFAYGQTGCGKTHTMMGVQQSQQLKGIIPRTFKHIVTITNSQKQKNYLISCSFIQIYNQEIHDLLCTLFQSAKDIKQRMELKESPDKGVFIKDLILNVCKTTLQMEKNMDAGFKNRAVGNHSLLGATAMNKDSSRSHSIFTIHVDSSEIDQSGNQRFTAGKLNLVDLAGSERQSKTNAVGDRLKEATKINLSLSALGNVISALVDGKSSHIPYRDSKLTRLLQDSLGGNTKTVMIAAISPADYNYDETMSTLRYASRAKNIQNKPKINEDPKDTLLREYAEQIKRLKLMLQGKGPINIKQIEKIQQRSQYRNNPQLDQELKYKDEQLLEEKNARLALNQQLNKLQNVVKKDPSTTVSELEMQKYKKLKQKLKNQKKKQQQMKKERQRRQEQLLYMQKNYRSLNEQVDEMRVRFQEIKKKYILSLSELKDTQIQHQNQKEDLLDTIRYQQKEIKFCMAAMQMLLNHQQIDIIRNQAQWKDQINGYKIPPFHLKNKNINFPKLKQKQAQAFVQEQKNKKKIIFQASRYNYNIAQEDEIEQYNLTDDNCENYNIQKQKYQNGIPNLNHVVKNAKEFNDTRTRINSHSKSINNNKKINNVHLSPLKEQNINQRSKMFSKQQRPIKKIMALEPIIGISSNGHFNNFKEFNRQLSQSQGKLKQHIYSNK